MTEFTGAHPYGRLVVFEKWTCVNGHSLDRESR
jgi:hypothetical protein